MLNVFITGASTGIGAALARQYASRGAVVGLVARNRDKLEALADALPGGRDRNIVLPCDVTVREEVFAAAEEFERLSGAHFSFWIQRHRYIQKFLVQKWDTSLYTPG